MLTVKHRPIEFRGFDLERRVYFEPIIDAAGNVFIQGDDGKLVPYPRPYALCQYTGNKDKLGAKIYEYDIIEQEMQNEFGSYLLGCGVVAYCTDCDQWEVREKNWASDGSSNSISKKCLVIGNVFLHPEIVGEKLSPELTPFSPVL